MKKISGHFWSKNIPVPNRDFSEISMKTDGKSTREKDHLGSGQLTTTDINHLSRPADLSELDKKS